MKLYSDPEVPTTVRSQPQPGDPGDTASVGVGGSAVTVCPAPAVRRPSDSRARPREKGVGMALTEPGLSTTLEGRHPI